MLSAASNNRPFLFTICAVEATSIEDWVSNASLRATLVEVVTSLSDPQLVFWQQGEADALSGTSTSDYRRGILQVLGEIRGRGMYAPVLMASATRCRKANGRAVRDAMRSIVDTTDHVFAGPDTDTIGDQARERGCHFTKTGVERAAGLWFSAMREPCSPNDP